jgi:hypothetical protein
MFKIAEQTRILGRASVRRAPAAAYVRACIFDEFSAGRAKPLKNSAPEVKALGAQIIGKF